MVLGLVFFLASGVQFHRQSRLHDEFSVLRTRAWEIRRAGGEVLQLLTDAETGQRGFVLTLRREFLAPYAAARAVLPAETRRLTASLRASSIRNPPAETLEPLVLDRLRLLDESVRLASSGDRAGALKLIESGIGKAKHDEVRRLVTGELAAAAAELDRKWIALEAASEQAARIGILAGVASLASLGCYAWALARASGHRQELIARLISQENLYRELARAQQRDGEAERSRMARKVHDEIGQTATAAKLEVTGILRSRGSNDSALNDRLDVVVDLLDETITVARDLSTELRPSLLERAGLLAACEWEFGRFTRGTGVEGVWRASMDEPAIPFDAKLALFRVMQEALSNALRHAGARKVTVTFASADASVELVVTDDGEGIDPARRGRPGLGVLSMRERLAAWGGDLEIRSEPGAGARLRAILPLATTMHAGSAGAGRSL